MKHYIIILLVLIDAPFLLCCGQDIKRAESLSRMADFYYSADNLDKAIEYEFQSLKIQDSIFGNNSIQYASSALNIAKYYYTRGNQKDDGNSQSDFDSATRHLIIAMNTIKNTLLDGFFEMDSQSKYQIWQSINNLFDNMLPSYVAKCPNDSTISCLFNTILFSKGITWRNESVLYANWRVIQANLQDDEIAIEFISPVTPESDNVIIYALTIKKAYTVPHMTKLFDIWQLQDSLYKCTSQKEKNLKVGKMIWQALSEDLIGIDNVYFSPTHILHNIPIEYLPKNKNEYYCDQYSFYRLSSTAEIAKPRVKKQFKKAILYGGLEYDYNPNLNNQEHNTNNIRSGFEPLYNTIIEVSEIKDLLKNNGIDCIFYTGVTGDKNTFQNLSGQEIDILHLATHGKWDHIGMPLDQDQAMLGSYLVLSGANSPNGKDNNDGIITAFEISNIDFSHIGLVVLSACESALGEYGNDDSLIGLQRGFKIAGANTILMSLDKVDDEATKILMVEFYRNLMSGKSKYQSLKDAQMYLRKVDNGKYDNPKYWASFIMLDGIN